MLLRSASTPILNSLVSMSKEFSQEPDVRPPIQKTRSVTHLFSSISLSSSYSSSPAPIDETMKKMKKNLSENDLRESSMPPPVPKRKAQARAANGVSSISKEEERVSRPSLMSLEPLFWASGLTESAADELQPLFLGGVGVTGGGGVLGGRGGGGGGGGYRENGDGGSGFSDPSQGSDVADAYYQKMIEANPGNALLLGNYAKFLKEVRGDLVKAEEYCSRAILANPAGDSDVLSLYGDLIWQTHKDASRAENYFDQAIQAAPDDCYAMASYARFLWDAEEEEEEPSFQSASPSPMTAVSH